MRRPVGAPAGRWPTRDELLLLRAALLDRSAALDSWHRFRSAHAGIDHLRGDAFRLLPLLFRNLQALEIDDPTLGRLKGVYRQAWYANQLLLRAGSEAVSLLRSAAVDTMLLEGGALVASHVHDVATRPMDRLDILVHPRDVSPAIEILGAAGWAHGEGGAPIRSRRFGRAIDLVSRGHAKLALQGWALFPGGYDDALWSAAGEVSLSGATTLAPSVADQLLLACVRGLDWIPAPLRWIPDAVLLTRGSADTIDWRRLVERARRCHVALDVAAGLEFLAAEFQVELPSDVPALLRRRAGAGERALHGVKMRPEPLGGLSRMVRRSARACEATRRLALTAAAADQHRMRLSMLVDVLGGRRLRVAAVRGLRTGLGRLRPGECPVSARTRSSRR